MQYNDISNIRNELEYLTEYIKNLGYECKIETYNECFKYVTKKFVDIFKVYYIIKRENNYSKLYNTIQKLINKYNNEMEYRKFLKEIMRKLEKL